MAALRHIRDAKGGAGLGKPHYCLEKEANNVQRAELLTIIGL